LMIALVINFSEKAFQKFAIRDHLII